MAQETSFDDELLKLELEELGDEFADISSITGFDEKEIAKLLGSDSSLTDESPAANENYQPKWLVLIECTDEKQ